MVLFTIPACNKVSNEIYQNVAIEEIINLAQEKRKSICLILFNDSSTIFSSYLNNMDKGILTNSDRVIFNIINVALPENKWYTQWLGADNHVITCVFSSSGVLLATITGASTYSFECINKSLNGDLSCNQFGFTPLFNMSENANKIDILNKILFCKLQYDKGMDIESDINNTLDIVQYPYNIYLKSLNLQKYKNEKEAIYLAKQLLTFDDIPYLRIYSDIFENAKYIVDNQYNPDNEAKLFIKPKEIILNNCIINQPEMLKIELFNKGNSLLNIKNIDLGCNCVRLIDTQTSFIINPNDSITLHLEFKSDKKGKIEREILFVSNAINSLEPVKIKAFVE
ncbi:DUF1573 domain-containing protein [Proteiniphilum propionicum]|uniref:DUF1573 domain-containing protein n=1 Tax=Proteiniphilum propionicum TaxID=2829812 RepID=UPI001EEA2C9E|nr:DUF1573 domain-containing protein [Proteiniphilum propionicum]ULB34408.1 DUF1573 domain-containing protein [Proteiniphilum propionicum]